MSAGFSPLNLNERSQYDALYQMCPEKPADLSFVNLWSWQDKYKYQWKFDEDLCWLRICNKDKTEYLAPVGNWRQKNWKRRLAALKLTELSLSRVPKSLVCGLKSEIPFAAVPDRGNWEYLYKVSDLTGLKGAGYKNKRRQLNRFLETYNYEYRPLGLREIPDLIELQRVWLEQKEITINNNLLAEHQAVLQLLENWQEFSSRMLGGVLYADGLPIAYTLAEKADREYLIVHFEKALYRYKGAYPAINWLFLKHLPESFEYVNREQDLGEEGLRRAKMEYNPVGFIKKYSLTAETVH